MITIGSFNAVVTSARLNEFDNKDKTKHFKMLEVSFFSDELRISGILTDWTLKVPVECLSYGTPIRISFDSCHPMKNASGFYEFRGEVSIVPPKK